MNGSLRSILYLATTIAILVLVFKFVSFMLPYVLIAALITFIYRKIKGNRAKYTEVESIFSFIVNGINGFLLAGETSIGKYPVEAFLFLKSLIEYYA